MCIYQYTDAILLNFKRELMSVFTQTCHHDVTARVRTVSLCVALISELSDVFMFCFLTFAPLLLLIIWIYGSQLLIGFVTRHDVAPVCLWSLTVTMAPFTPDTLLL